MTPSRRSVVTAGVLIRTTLRDDGTNRDARSSHLGLGLGDGVFAEVEDRRGKHRIGAADGHTLHEVVDRADTTTGDHRHGDGIDDRLGQVEYRLRHLLVANEASARQLIGRIQSGTPMADLVEAYSLDAGTRSTDGLAGWVPRGHLHEALVQAVDRLKPGMTSPQPVRTVAGWHVLQLEDARPLVQPPFEAIRPLIVRVLAQKTVDRQIQVLRSTAKIE